MEVNEHSHICEMNLRVATCLNKIPCTDHAVNGECHLPRIFGICSNYECRMMAELDRYKLALEEISGDLIKEKQKNDLFRNLLLGAVTAEKFLEDGTMYQSGIDAQINRSLPSLDNVSTDTVLFLVTYHQKYAEKYTQWLREKRSTINIKKELIEKRKEETENTVKITEAHSKQRKVFDKAVANYVKLGMPKDKAEEFVRKMGMKEQ